MGFVQCISKGAWWKSKTFSVLSTPNCDYCIHTFLKNLSVAFDWVALHNTFILWLEYRKKYFKKSLLDLEEFDFPKLTHKLFNSIIFIQIIDLALLQSIMFNVFLGKNSLYIMSAWCQLEFISYFSDCKKFRRQCV